MPRDTAVNSGLDIYFDATNDLATVEGDANVEQSVALDTLNVTEDVVGSRLTQTAVTKLTSSVRDALASDPQISSVGSVRIDQVNADSNTVEVSALVDENKEFSVVLG